MCYNCFLDILQKAWVHQVWGLSAAMRHSLHQGVWLWAPTNRAAFPEVVLKIHFLSWHFKYNYSGYYFSLLSFPSRQLDWATTNLDLVTSFDVREQHCHNSGDISFFSELYWHPMIPECQNDIHSILHRVYKNLCLHFVSSALFNFAFFFLIVL